MAMMTTFNASGDDNDDDHDMDEFGDASFLLNVDVDAAVAAHRSHNESKNDTAAAAAAAAANAATGLAVHAAASNNNNYDHHDDDEDNHMAPDAKRIKTTASSSVAAGVTRTSTTSPKAATSEPTTTNTITATTTRDLEACLQQYFGHTSYRPGQREVIHALVVEKRDACVFWATGQGKSLVYQIPALLSLTESKQSKSTALVVSPLISLMQDQVHKLNGLLVSASSSEEDDTRPLATYLGSAQTNAVQEEELALEGYYRLVYLTPEKLMSADFLQRLAHAHNSCNSRLRLCCVAFDEAHCVSQWGHDFRPEYRAAGRALRTQTLLARIPIVALTATAVPRIQHDICQSLGLRVPLMSKQSFDRSNLTIKVQIKPPQDALRVAMEPLIQSLLMSSSAAAANKSTGGGATSLSLTSSSSSSSSTIVYAMTRQATEDVASYLQQRLQQEQQQQSIQSPSNKDKVIRVEAYHAGMSPTQRHDTHVGFLTGQIAVVVATVAFGMGIDLPSIRRIVHWGPPKTVEEYYQQIGRAGRDGLPSECILYTSTTEFDRYLDDFYLPSAKEARQASIASTRALKAFALDKETCRRKAILNFFEEDAPFGDRCGTCDNCLARQRFGNDATRDFCPEARLILMAVAALREQGISTIEKVLKGTIVEDYRYNKGRGGGGSNVVSPQTLQATLMSNRNALPRTTKNIQFLKELIPSLVSKGFLQESTKTSSGGGSGSNYTRSWTVYNVTPTGRAVMTDESTKVMLPVPDSLREAERQEQVRRERTLQQLTERGVSLDQVPAEEIRQGDGDVIRAYTKWTSYVATHEKLGHDERCLQLRELLTLVQEWRSRTAIRLTMAPVSVLAEHILLALVYTTATLSRGVKVEKAALLAAGARNRELDSLVALLNDWIDRYTTTDSAVDTTASSSDRDTLMSFPSGAVQPPHKWPFAVYKPNKKTGQATWESSYNRFETEGESPQAIAMAPENGRPIQVATVVGHILDGLLLGRPVNLKRLVSFLTPPTKGEWARLEMVQETTGMDPVGDPTISGAGGGPFRLGDFLRPIMGDDFIDAPKEDRLEPEKIEFGKWCNLLKWYLALKRTGVKPTFDG